MLRRNPWTSQNREWVTNGIAIEVLIRSWTSVNGLAKNARLRA